MKYRYKVEGLTCANCARKIEEMLKQEGCFKNAIVNFNTQTIICEADRDEIFTVKSIVYKIEPEAKVVYMGGAKAEEKNTVNSLNIIRYILGIIVFVASVIVKNEVVKLILVVLAYLLLIYRIFWVAIKKLFKNGIIDENILICISAIGAYLVNKPMEGIMVLALYEFGKMLEAKAVNNTRRSIKEILNIRPEYANLKKQNGVVKVSPEDIKVEDVILIKPGEKIPLDGIVVSGNSNVNNAALTGEAKYISVVQGDYVYAGGINIDGLLEVKVTKKYVDTTLATILELTENATNRKAKTENMVSKLAKVYVPLVMILAVMVSMLLPLITDLTYSQSIYRGLIFLVISCPCAIAISVPLGYFCGIGKASSIGILIKGSDYLDGLKDVNTIVMDKTGTITVGEFVIDKVITFTDQYTQSQLLEYCRYGESMSNHPLAKAIVSSCSLDTSKVKKYEELSGKGISYELNDKKVLVGNEILVGIEKANLDNTAIYVKVDNTVIGYIELKDKIKDSAKDAIKELQKNNIQVKMFTGDNENVAKEVAATVGIQDVSHNMLPQDKFNKMQELLDNNHNGNTKVAFVGDGINDSPVLALSDIGISMGISGSNSAIEASDVVILSDDLTKINAVIKISKYTNRIIKENLIFAIGTKVTFLLLSALGLTGMAFAVFADVGVTVIAILNSIRILRHKI